MHSGPARPSILEDTKRERERANYSEAETCLRLGLASGRVLGRSSVEPLLDEVKSKANGGTDANRPFIESEERRKGHDGQMRGVLRARGPHKRTKPVWPVPKPYAPAKTIETLVGQI
jgi:hypothetical protein